MMNEKDSSEKSELGRNMNLAFTYVQQIFKETAQLMKKLDSLMGKDWTPTYGNRTTKDVTSHINEPERWLVEASFRIYDSKNQNNIKKGITVAYLHEDYDQPILIIGELNYILDPTTGNLKEENHWDLWDAWFSEGYEERKTDGTVYLTKPEEEYVAQAKVFAIPLVSIKSESDIKTNIYEKLIAL